MSHLDQLEIELTIEVGAAELPLGRLSRLQRGAIIPLGRDDRKPLNILANGRKIANGRVVLQGERVSVAVD